MSINLPNNKQLEAEKKHIKFLLAEFRKIKMECLEICEKLNKQLPNLQKYEIMEVTCTRKIDSMDIIGVIKLKKELISSMAEISVIQKQMSHKAHKNSFKKAIVSPAITQRQIINNQELGPFEIPTYLSKDEQNDKKIDRLSSFILSLGRSMNALQKCMKGQWEEEQFYKYEPQYLQTIRKVERFKMRDEELSEIVRQKFQKQLASILGNGQNITDQNDDKYVTVKIPKKIIAELAKKRKNEANDMQYELRHHTMSSIEGKKKSNKRIPLQKINEEKGSEHHERPQNMHIAETSYELHVNSFQKGNQNSRLSNRLQADTNEEAQNGNFVYMVKKISPDSKMNSSMASSISSLRSLRRKVFQDDIWDQFQKI